LSFEFRTVDPGGPGRNVLVDRFSREQDILKGETRTPAYLEKNPNGRIPLLELEDGRCIADIALYAYTHVAEEGGFELGPYAAIRAWCRRVREQPGHIPITEG